MKQLEIQVFLIARISNKKLSLINLTDYWKEQDDYPLQNEPTVLSVLVLSINPDAKLNMLVVSLQLESPFCFNCLTYSFTLKCWKP